MSLLGNMFSPTFQEMGQLDALVLSGVCEGAAGAPSVAGKRSGL